MARKLRDYEVIKLKAEFDLAMIKIFERARDELGEKGTRFIQGVGKLRGVGEAKRNLAKRGIPKGLRRIAECRRLDLSVERWVLRPRFRRLFTELEIETARQRLARMKEIYPA